MTSFQRYPAPVVSISTVTRIKFCNTTEADLQYMVILQVGIGMDSGCASVTVSTPQIKLKECVLTHH